MANSNPIFIPLSKLNNGNNCVTHKLENFSGNIHYTPNGVLICFEYDSLEEDLEQVSDSFGLGESNRQLIRRVVLPADVVVTVGIINEEAVAAAAAAVTAADEFDGIKEGPTGEEENKSGDGDGVEFAFV